MVEMIYILPSLTINISFLCAALGLLPQTIKSYRANKLEFRKMSVLESTAPLVIIIAVNFIVMILLSNSGILYLYPFIPSLVVNTEILIAVYSIFVNRKSGIKVLGKRGDETNI